VDIYIHSLTRLHGVVLNYLSKGTTLLYLYAYLSLLLFNTIYWKSPGIISSVSYPSPAFSIPYLYIVPFWSYLN
jgi:hypothetical protein